MIRIERKSAQEFFDSHYDDFVRVFPQSSPRVRAYKNWKNERNSAFFLLFSGNKLSCFFSLTEVDKEVLELGDVVKLDRSVPRKKFAKFLGLVSALYRKRGFELVGFPNAKAIKLELDAGWEKIYLLEKQVQLIVCNFVLSLPIMKTGGSYGVTLNSLTPYFSRLRKSRKRFLYAACNDGSEFCLVGYSIRYCYKPLSHSDQKRSFVISYRPSYPPIKISFSNSDNSA